MQLRCNLIKSNLNKLAWLFFQFVVLFFLIFNAFTLTHLSAGIHEYKKKNHNQLFSGFLLHNTHGRIYEKN